MCVLCVCKRLCVGNSYKYMYEKCAGGLLDALVIVQYMHAVYSCIYGKWFALIAVYIRRRGAVGKWRGDDRQSITGNDKHK